uniref:CTLH domain-containing protein n=1 Tax=Salix viminalis TaxID=40686 RepID=A0A6N2NA01_SALVM
MTADLLQEESRIPLDSPELKLLKKQVLDGNWEESVKTLCTISLLDKATRSLASFLILEQKFLKFLRMDNNVLDALNVLRKEIVPLGINLNRVHELAAWIISPSGYRNTAQDAESANSDILKKLLKLLPPSLAIPPTRLESIVEEVLDLQRGACLFHNVFDRDLSLYLDHQCGRGRLPSSIKQILQVHTDEVWFLQFSHNGKYLASSSKDKSAIIWQASVSLYIICLPMFSVCGGRVNIYVMNGGKVSWKHTLIGHQKAVLTVSWSPDDSQLLTCGEDEVIRRWDANLGQCLHVYEKAAVGFISCAWSPDGRVILAGMTNKSFSLWNVNGAELDCWGENTLRLSETTITHAGDMIAGIFRGNTIVFLDWEDKRCRKLIREEEVITSFSLSKDNKFLLVNLTNQEIHLWNLEGYPRIVARYKGHTRSRFIIRSCFGGCEEAFIASGSEDSQVYVWHRRSGKPIQALDGHSGAVNCVSWNPVNIYMLASASDDGAIRIWGPDPRMDQYGLGFESSRWR